MKKSHIILGITLIMFFMATICFFVTSGAKSIAQETKKFEGKEIMEQMQLMQSLYVINSLNLSTDQVKALIPVIEEGAALKNEIDSKKEGIESQIAAKLGEVNKNLANNINPSKETLTGLMDMKKEMRSIPESYKDKASALSEKVDKILTEEQKEKVENYNPGKALKEILGEKNNPGEEQMDEHNSKEDMKEHKPGKEMKAKIGERIEKILQIAREGSDEEYAKKKDEGMGKLSAMLARRNVPWSEIQTKVSEIGKILDNARSLTQKDFDAQKSDLCDKVIATLKGGKREDMKSIRLLLNPSLLPVLKGRI